MILTRGRFRLFTGPAWARALPASFGILWAYKDWKQRQKDSPGLMVDELSLCADWEWHPRFIYLFGNRPSYLINEYNSSAWTGREPKRLIAVVWEFHVSTNWFGRRWYFDIDRIWERRSRPSRSH